MQENCILKHQELNPDLEGDEADLRSWIGDILIEKQSETNTKCTVDPDGSLTIKYSTSLHGAPFDWQIKAPRSTDELVRVFCLVIA